MKKKVLVVTALTLMLAACSDNEEAEKAENQADGNEQEEVVEDEEFSLEVTDEEWLALSNQSSWWEENDLKEPEFGQAAIVQFDEDTIPEVVIPYTQQEGSQGLLIGKYNENEEKWAISQNIPIDNKLKIEILKDKLTFSNGAELLITQESDDKNKALATYKYSNEEEKVIPLSRIAVDVDQAIEVKPADNTVSYFVDGEEKKETVEE